MTTTYTQSNGVQTVKKVDRPSPAQLREMKKYDRAYASKTYRMGDLRKKCAWRDLSRVACSAEGVLCKSFLDVGCGRGEMLDLARDLGFARVIGTEVVPALVAARRDVIYAPGWHLPFENRAFEVVGCFDVIEHILPGDDELLCRELDRVAGCHVIITANNLPSALPDGTELHVNRRPYEEWDGLFRKWFARGTVHRLERAGVSGSETWQVSYAD